MKRTVAVLLTIAMLLSCMTVFGASSASQQVYSTETAENDIVFHHKDAEKTGTWTESWAMKNYDGKAHEWSNESGATITFAIKDVKAGNYEAYYWVCPHMYNIEKMDFTVSHNDKESKTFVHQRLDDGEKVTAGWVSMGVFDFTGKGDEKFFHENPGGNTRATAIKLIPTQKEVTVPDTKQEEAQKPVEDVPVIGEKRPHSDSQLKNITVAPAGKCTWTGEWTFSSVALGPMVNLGQSMWIAGVGEEATVTYNPEISAVGDVNVFVYLLYWASGQNDQVKYEVHHNGKVDEVILDPTTLTESAWVYLGTYDFKGTPESEFVKLVCVENENAKANTRASTVMFEIVNSANGGIWQTRYVTPYQSLESVMESANLATLDKFADMKDHWAHYDVEYMANEGLVSGVSDTEFDPEAKISRAEYVTILDRALGYELVSGESYPDVPETEWYATYVATAKENGLLNGLPTEDGFKPEQPITRQEMALFTYNAIKQIGRNDEWLSDMPDTYQNFTDTDSVSDWAEDALKYLIQTGIIKGTSDTTVSALENATRAQGAVILKRFMQMFVWAGPPTDKEWVLTFNDEFNGTEPDWSVWQSDASAPGHILSSRWPENVEVHDGAMHLVVRREEREGKFWTSGSVWVRTNVFHQKYGYWEARYKYTASPGINNAFWTIYPVSGTGLFELDINEGHYPNKVNTNYHTTVTGERKQHSQGYTSPYDLSADYHTYALEWTPEKLIFYFDGKKLREQENYNANALQSPYLSTAVLNWAGAITDAADGTAQIIDYVRIWQYPEYATDTTMTKIGKPVVGAQPSASGTAPTTVAGVTVKEIKVKDQPTDNQTYDGEIIITPELTGTWNESWAIKNYDGKAHKWTNEADAKSVYPLADVVKGKYKVYMWRAPHLNNIRQMDMLLTQNGEDKYLGSLALILGADEKADAGWVLLGECELTGDKNASVNYTCTGTNCRATAIKLVPVK